MTMSISHEDNVIRAAFGGSDDQAAVAALRARLEAGASAVVDTIDTMVGPLVLCVTPVGLAQVAFGEIAPALAESISDRFELKVTASSRRVAPYAQAFADYFQGRAHRVDVPLDLGLLQAPYRREVIAYLPHIPYGATASYEDVAEATGRPRAMRAVGSACAHNPVPIALPCHRVVRKDGDIGSYIGGPAIKRELLEFEAAHVR